MGRKSRRSRSVYDPSISDGLERSQELVPIHVQLDALTLQSLEEANSQVELVSHLQREKNETLRRRCRLFASLSLMIVTAVIIAACVLKKDGKKGSSSTSTSLPPPPSDIASKCTIDKIATSKGAITCKLDCEVADCCIYPRNLGLSCLEGNEDTCLQYHGNCSILDGITTRAPASNTSNISLAPKNIVNLCSNESMSTVGGLQECTEACERGECCWQVGVPSCTSSPQCHSFASCLSLRAKAQYEAGKKGGWS